MDLPRRRKLKLDRRGVSAVAVAVAVAGVGVGSSAGIGGRAVLTTGPGDLLGVRTLGFANGALLIVGDR